MQNKNIILVNPVTDPSKKQIKLNRVRLLPENYEAAFELSGPPIKENDAVRLKDVNVVKKDLLSYIGQIINQLRNEIALVSNNIGSIVAGINTFEYYSKNLKSNPYELTYSSGRLIKIAYNTTAGTVNKNFNYTGDLLTSIVFDGPGYPLSITTKTLTYSGNVLTTISYS